VIESNWASAPTYSLGVEEEVMILDAETLEPRAAVDVLLDGVDGVALPGRLKTELHASVVELNTEICASPDEAAAALAELRVAADRVARRNGLRIAAAGTHPFAAHDAMPVVQEARYLEMIETVGYAARRQGVNGLHVHVAVNSAEECWERLEAVLPWLPALLALSANSPYLGGEATGMLSNRAPILAELPRSGAPPPFASYAEWEAWVETRSAAGAFADYTRLWWDVRPNPRFGTLEIRMPDQPTALDRTALLVSLVRELVERAPARERDAGLRGDYAQNRWAAASFGLEAPLVHPDGNRLESARELVAGILGADPPQPEALRQLAAADAQAACAELAELTVAFA
jgi:carboxylate-amine ligase